MKRHQFNIEFEINATPKLIYPYLSTDSGLQEWFADEVHSLPDKSFNMVWDGLDHIAKVVSRRTNSHIKFQFMESNEEERGHDEIGYLEFKLDFNEMTQTTFMKITDYSDMDDDDDLKELWGQLIGKLKEITGASNSTNI